jgi:branched-chain amino acid transport system substrate-binding protein
MRLIAALVVILAGLTAVVPNASARTIKVGVIACFTGPFAHWGDTWKRVITVFQEENGNKVGNDTIEIIYRDERGTDPAIPKRLAEELIVQDRIDVLAGFTLTPSALAVADVITEAKMPAVIFNAATHFITRKSPMFTRVSATLDASMVPLVGFAAKNGIKSGMIVVTDYTPGIEAAKTYNAEFAKNGIKQVGEIKMPLATKDFAVYIEKVIETKPEGMFVFLPAGSPSITFVKTAGDRGLMKGGTRIFALGEFGEQDLQSFGDVAIGANSAFYYSQAHDSDLNRKFVASMKKKFPQNEVDFISVIAWDGMHVIYEMAKRTGGKFGPDAIAQVKGMAWESPRGPMSIDPKERDAIQNIYVRRVEKGPDGKLINKEIETIPNVKDPWKEANPE